MIYLLPQLVTSAAEHEPDKRAVVCRDRFITYSELHQRASGLATTLIDLGVRKGDRVGIYQNKSLESVVAIHGIMMAGAAYVPIDPRSPISRIQFVIEDCGIEHLVSEDRKTPRLRDLADRGTLLRTVIGVNDDDIGHDAIRWEQVAATDFPPAVGVTEQDLCYILYTSGSTGVPKGIMHTHRSALSWANVAAAVYRITPDDIISNYAPLHFDLSTLDLFGGARAGATMVMVPEEHLAFPSSLAALLESENLTLFYTVPMALIQLGQPGVLDGRDLSSLTRVLFGGEPMPLKHLRRIMTVLPQATFYNVYGPTEVNGVTHFEVVDPPDHEMDSLPIGSPYPNVEARVLDPEGANVAPGEIGELAIRSPTMMRGYWGRPELNESAFLFDDRYSGIPDVFHKTGDLVALGGDGHFRFHGRKDRQIKSRGYRVELDEVEAILVAHPDVAEAAVFAVKHDDDALSIHAAAIPRMGSDIDDLALSSHLASLLPPYAVPETLMVREELPRTTSGKIDRLRLASERRQVGTIGGRDE